MRLCALKEGDDVLLPSLGVVHICRVYPSGAAIVRDTNGKPWLVTADQLAAGEPCLFTNLE